MFVKASRLKLRFSTSKGLISVEDLWDLPLTALDTIAKNLNKEVKESAEESFIKMKTSASTLATLRFEIVKYIIEVKLNEAEAAQKRAENKERKAQILALIAEKQNKELSEKSIADLMKELEGLD